MSTIKIVVIEVPGSRHEIEAGAPITVAEILAECGLDFQDRAIRVAGAPATLETVVSTDCRVTLSGGAKGN